MDQSKLTTESFQMKIHILEALYIEILDNSLYKAVKYLMKLVISNDSYLQSQLGSYDKLISKLVYHFLNILYLRKHSSFLSEYFLGYIRLNTRSLSQVNTLKQILSYIIVQAILPNLIKYILNKLKQDNNSKKKVDFIETMISLLRLGYKLVYSLSKTFIYTSILDHIMGIFTVNRGEKITVSNLKDKYFDKSSSRFSLFLIYMFIRFGEWYYSKEQINRNETKKFELPNKSNPNSSDIYNRIQNNTNLRKEIDENSCLFCSNEEFKRKPVACRFCGIVSCYDCFDEGKDQMKTRCCQTQYTKGELICIRIYESGM